MEKKLVIIIKFIFVTLGHGVLCLILFLCLEFTFSKFCILHLSISSCLRWRELQGSTEWLKEVINQSKLKVFWKYWVLFSFCVFFSIGWPAYGTLLLLTMLQSRIKYKDQIFIRIIRDKFLSKMVKSYNMMVQMII